MTLQESGDIARLFNCLIAVAPGIDCERLFAVADESLVKEICIGRLEDLLGIITTGSNCEPCLGIGGLSVVPPLIPIALTSDANDILVLVHVEELEAELVLQGQALLEFEDLPAILG